jgi:Flp pilus assembly protein TadD/peroxiredoxin
MPHRQNESQGFSRRTFLRQLRWAPTLFLPAPLFGSLIHPGHRIPRVVSPSLSSAQTRLAPHYPSKSPLDDILRLATPGRDEYVTEGYAAELISQLDEWSEHLRSEPPAPEIIGTFLHSSIQFTSLLPIHETPLRPGDRIKVTRKEFGAGLLAGRESFLAELRKSLATFRKIETADFEICGCSLAGDSPLTLEVKIRYDLVGTREDQGREERIGWWRIRWVRDNSGFWMASKWTAEGETVSRTHGKFFLDVSSQALGHIDSYNQQLLRGTDYWRTVLDGAIGVDVYGNNGLAVGDFDNDGLDDLYLCQPAGLPNRLYHNRGDGTFEDVTQEAGVGVLDFTACALFADFQNRGVQDLLVVGATGPSLFLNDGKGRFTLKRDAFRFARPPQGSFTHAAAADYDGDGRLDLYFCLYSYYQGLDQYRYPVPYFDARNGPPNYLFHNQGNAVFEDRTDAAGLNIENDRYSFACSWGDSAGDGRPDLYVVNDFGRNNLYRNQGDGTFKAVSREAQVDEAGAGMSACWLDFNNDGKQDIYAAGMWVAAGLRVFDQAQFHATDPTDIRTLYQRHVSGNCLYQNDGEGKFRNVATNAGVEVGRWSWSTDSWDFDHDGYPDLYVANGYISGLGGADVSSFFWRQVVAKSPSDATPSPRYERGWSAMNELIRSDATWNGHERNVFFVNNRDGTFSDASGVVGLDFRDDSRAFALADLDGDGRLEVILKNRTAPQVRILRLAMDGIGNSIAFRLRGKESNRDAIGTCLTVEAGGTRQTKYLQAGSGFLSQHTKELFFGFGEKPESVRASLRWPSGLRQTFDRLPMNHRIEIEEGGADFAATPFASAPQAWAQPGALPVAMAPPLSLATWLIEPVRAPDFSLPDLAGNLRDLSSFQHKFVLLILWTKSCSLCLGLLRSLERSRPFLASHGLGIAAMNVDDESEQKTLRSFAAGEDFSFPILLASEDTAGVYNIVHRYLFDRHRDLPLPTSFLIDSTGNIVKVYQGSPSPETVLEDAESAPSTPSERVQRALPFPGMLVRDTFQRNAFTYGVAFFQHGLLHQATESFLEAIVEKPDDPDAYYNLGTLLLQRNSPSEAERYLRKAAELRPNYPEAWNNLGMLAAEKGNDKEAIQDFERALELRATYATALLNLGNLYRRQGNLEQSQTLLLKAFENEPENAEVNYGMGMLYARQDQSERARQYLERAISLRPDYADALNNLGVLLVKTKRYPEAEDRFKVCIQQAPSFDQAYLNLARLYLVLNDKDKARRVLQSLLQQQPEHKMAQQMLQMLY